MGQKHQKVNPIMLARRIRSGQLENCKNLVQQELSVSVLSRSIAAQTQNFIVAEGNLVFENSYFDPNRHFAHQGKNCKILRRYFQPVSLQAICVGLVHLGQTSPPTGGEKRGGGGGNIGFLGGDKNTLYKDYWE